MPVGADGERPALRGGAKTACDCRGLRPAAPARGLDMARTTMNLQDGFLNQVRKENTEIKMVLLDGSELVGLVRGFDNFTVIVASQATQHLIYKHAIAQIIIPRSSGRGPDSHEPGESHGHESAGERTRRDVRARQARPDRARGRIGSTSRD